MILDSIIPMIADVIWGVFAFCGVAGFFTGNGGAGSLAGSIPLLCGAGTYYAISRYSSYGRLLAFIGGIVIMFIMFMVLASRIKIKKDNEELVNITDIKKNDEKTE